MTKQAKAKFQAELLLAGKTATGIEIPPEVVESLGAGKKPPVAVTINGHTYRSTVASRSGRFLVGVSAENRAAADVAAGDKIEVELELDDKPREVRVPDDLAAALDRDAKAKSFFEELTYSQKKWYVLPIEEAKKQETRERRLDKALQMLREGRKR
jgi:Bacteriocin-protection, YdeI or OmpD-Associated/Domain of unknown function (DUF1905)